MARDLKSGLLHNRLHDGVFEVPVYLAVRVVGLDHHHADQLLLRIDPEVGTVSTVPAEAALRNAAARGDGVADDFDAESIASARRAPREGVGHESGRERNPFGQLPGEPRVQHVELPHRGWFAAHAFLRWPFRVRQRYVCTRRPKHLLHQRRVTTATSSSGGNPSTRALYSRLGRRWCSIGPVSACRATFRWRRTESTWFTARRCPTAS